MPAAISHPFAFDDTAALTLESTDCKSLAKLLTPPNRLIIWPHADARSRVWWPFVRDDPLRIYMHRRGGKWLQDEAAWALADAAIPDFEARAHAHGCSILHVPSPADQPYHNAVIHLWHIDKAPTAPIAIAEFDVRATARRCGLATGYQTHLLRRSKFRLPQDIELLTLVTATHSEWPKLISRPVSPFGLASELRRLGAIVNEHGLDADLQQRWREMPVVIVQSIPQNAQVEIHAQVRNPRHWLCAPTRLKGGWSGVSRISTADWERLREQLGQFSVRVEQLGLGSATEASRLGDVPTPRFVSSKTSIAAIPILEQPQSGIHIDPIRLAELRADTVGAQALLASIFLSDEQKAPDHGVARDFDKSDLDGLDRHHAELVENMEGKGAVNRADFVAIAKSLRLLPDGAIERINDWAFDHFDERLLDEDGDMIVLVAHLRERLAKLRETSRL